MDLTVCILWHMHQPLYLDEEAGESVLPWVFLHGVKDYYEMARHLEAVEGMRATVNFVPSLLDQLEIYARPGIPPDRFLRHVAMDPGQMDQAARDFIRHFFFSANQERQILPSPRYAELFQRAHGRGSNRATPLSPQDLLDLQVCFLLAWCGGWLRQEDPLVARLVAKGHNFSSDEKMALLARMQVVVGEIVGRYRALAAAGRVELSFTPYYHPILPLLCDTNVGYESNAAIHLPQHRVRRPGDAAAQVERGIARHTRAFGAPPAGCWPAEGGLSQQAVDLLANAHSRWAAGDEAVLFASLGRSPRADGEVVPELYRLYAAPGAAANLTLAFRDHDLSDRIGFTYSRWDSEAAVADLITHLQTVRKGLQGRTTRPVVNLILDGENAWEFYPENGRPFLLALYRALSQTDGLVVRTLSGAIDAGCDRGRLDHLHPGSWIHGNFNIWIGHPEKNLAWDWVARAATVLDQATEVDEPRRQQAYASLLAAEGSDWFWWYGDDHYSAQDTLFDHLFRAHLRHVYRVLGRPVPDGLHLPIARMRRAVLEMPRGLVHPHLDGKGVRYLDWLSAGRLDLARASAMHPGDLPFTELRFGFDEQSLYLQLAARASLTELCGDHLTLTFHLEGASNGTQARVVFTASRGAAPSLTLEGGADPTPQPIGSAALGDLLEVAIPLAPLALATGQTFHLSFGLPDHPRLPLDGPVELTIPAATDYRVEAWMA